MENFEQKQSYPEPIKPMPNMPAREFNEPNKEELEEARREIWELKNKDKKGHLETMDPGMLTDDDLRMYCLWKTDQLEGDYDSEFQKYRTKVDNEDRENLKFGRTDMTGWNNASEQIVGFLTHELIAKVLESRGIIKNDKAH